MPDYSEIDRISQKMSDTSAKLGLMAGELADAKQVLSWESERRKCLLAKFTVGYLDQDIGAGASEMRAKADSEYIKGMADLRRQSREAEQVVCKADALKTEFESFRSLLSVQKQILGLV